MDKAGKFAAAAILAIDTLWGGDVMCASGTGRFIADSWFSDEPLPLAYTHPTAARVRQTGGVSGDREAVRAYLAAIDLPGAISQLKSSASTDYLKGLILCFETMWNLAMEILGDGPAVPYATCVNSSTGRPPEPSDPQAKRERLTGL